MLRRLFPCRRNRPQNASTGPRDRASRQGGRQGRSTGCSTRANRQGCRQGKSTGRSTGRSTGLVDRAGRQGSRQGPPKNVRKIISFSYFRNSLSTWSCRPALSRPVDLPVDQPCRPPCRPALSTSSVDRPVDQPSLSTLSTAPIDRPVDRPVDRPCRPPLRSSHISHMRCETEWRHSFLFFSKFFWSKKSLCRLPLAASLTEATCGGGRQSGLPFITNAWQEYRQGSTKRPNCLLSCRFPLALPSSKF